MGQRIEMVNADGERAVAFTGISWWTFVTLATPILNSIPLFSRGDMEGARNLFFMTVIMWIFVWFVPIMQILAFAFWISSAFWVNDRHLRWLKRKGFRPVRLPIVGAPA